MRMEFEGRRTNYQNRLIKVNQQQQHKLNSSLSRQSFLKEVC